MKSEILKKMYKHAEKYIVVDEKYIKRIWIEKLLKNGKLKNFGKIRKLDKFPENEILISHLTIGKLQLEKIMFWKLSTYETARSWLDSSTLKKFL